MTGATATTDTDGNTGTESATLWHTAVDQDGSQPSGHTSENFNVVRPSNRLAIDAMMSSTADALLEIVQYIGKKRVVLFTLLPRADGSLDVEHQNCTSSPGPFVFEFFDDNIPPSDGTHEIRLLSSSDFF